MLDRARKIKVGLFALCSGLVFFALLLLAIGTSFTRTMVRYTIQFEETVKGMVIGSAVNFQGVQIGGVADMRFVGGRTEVVIEIDPDKAPITGHCRASLDRAWVTGQVTVELSGWQQDAELLPQGALIRAQLSPMSSLARTLPAMLGEVEATLGEYRKVAENLNALLGGRSGEEFVALLRSSRELVDGLAASSGPLLRRLDQETLPRVHGLLDRAQELEPELGALLVSLRRFAGQLETLGAEPGLQDAIAVLPELLTSVRETSERLGQSADELRHLLRGQGPSLGAGLASLDGALRELTALARLLRSAPSALVFGETKRERIPTAPARRDE